MDRNKITITNRKRKIVESFLDRKFKNCTIKIIEKEFNLPDGFFLKEKHYFLCATQILYQWERPDSFKVAFDYDFFRELEKFVPLRGKKQFFRDWLFREKFPNFEFKHLLEKKFFYYQ